MALKIRRDPPVKLPIPAPEATPAKEELLVCKHPTNALTSEGRCWMCDVKRLRKIWYPSAADYNKEDETMKIKREGSTKVAAPAIKKADKKAAPAKAKAAQEPVKRSEGRTLKLGVVHTWVHLFQENERCKAADRRTDAEITEFLKKEFPERHSKVFEAVATVRSRYNKGLLTKGEVPKTQSSHYNKEEAPKASLKKSSKK
jgi:hypothetical protein